MKELTLSNGIIHEKLNFDEAYYKKNNVFDNSLHICGAGMDDTIITWGDAGLDAAPDDAKKLGTFRSYTVFVTGQDVLIENLTIENSAGDGRLRGQAIALYSDAARVTCRNVHFKGHQDTLFMSPLPEQEREIDGFRGPRQNTPRIMTRQIYENCIIEGDVDFIFGGAEATFVNCTIVSLYRKPLEDAQHPEGSDKCTSAGAPVQGFVCAPNTPEGQKGLTFRNCNFTTDCCPDGSVYLARPWRPYGAVTFENCSFGPHIAPEKFAGWKDIHNVEETARFQII